MAKPLAEIVVFVTTPSEEEATRISRSLVEAGLVACANVLPRVRSIFRWEGKVTEELESLIVLKTRSGRFKELAMTIKNMHSYSVPEIIAIPIVQGSAEYLSWIRDVTSKELK
ncbi:MAG: divalent-cation tolerance protein CutA [Nitrospiraceae bacterium]